MNFASDNAGPAAPEIMTAVLRANSGYEPSYGAEPAMDRVRALVREQFEAPEAEVFLVATGTAANVISLACLCPPWARVYCHEESHLEQDECGAPEFFTHGAKLHLLPGDHGKIAPETLRAAIEATPKGFVHAQQPGAVSITNLTEAGTAYTPDEVAALAAIASEHGLPFHMDGARFANAVAGLDVSPAALTTGAGVTALSLGGTKNGCLGVEAVVLFDPSLAWEFELRRKRGAHLFSKHRYLSAQMEASLEDGLWLTLAANANAMAKALAGAIDALPGGSLVHPRDGNEVFARFPRVVHRRLMDAGAKYYLWPFDQSLDGPGDEPLSCRLVTNWSTTGEEISAFLNAMKGG
ncbi:MAG: threonine aldolase family protein [Rubricella sp.]